MAMTDVPWATDVPAPQARMSLPDPDAVVLEKLLATFITIGSTMDPRSRQVGIGSSEVGWPCDRRIAYRLSATRAINTNHDPLRKLIGLGTHKALADAMHAVDAGSNTLLVERPVIYRGIPGTVDLALLLSGLLVVVDWKTTTCEKISRLKREGPPRHYKVQANMYAAGLRTQGHEISHVALCFIPIDAKPNEGLSKLWVWRAPFDQAMADDAVDRIARLRGKRPSEVDAKPDRLCTYCSHYDPNATDADLGCRGPQERNGA